MNLADIFEKASAALANIRLNGPILAVSFDSFANTFEMPAVILPITQLTLPAAQAV